MTDSVGTTTGGVRALLSVEGLIALGCAFVLYSHTGRSWGLFAALFLAPDPAMLGNLAGPRIGAVADNAVHSYIAPLIVAVATRGEGLAHALALIAVAHVGFERMLGYGLKYTSAFMRTHLGRIGRAASGASAG